MMDLSRWPDADALLDRAFSLPPAERLPFLQQHAAHDPDLLGALRSIVAEADCHDGFLEPGGALSGPLGAEIGQAVDSGNPPTAVLEPGTLVEHYQILELIGRGGMGEVYRARDPRLGRDVALKVLPTRFARDSERIARFRREARVLAALSHPGIGAIYGVTEATGVEALVLELVEGPTLAERIAQGPLPVAEAVAIGRQLVEALAAAHASGILHRDLKPGNIKLTPDGRVKILDFGLGKALDRHDTGPGADLTSMSPGAMLGTAAYMSPEQVRREPLDRRSDIWAFGCVVFEMLTGQRAFVGGSVPDVMRHVLEFEPAYNRLPDATPSSLRRLLRKTLEKDPRRRLADISEALADLEPTAITAAVPARANRLRWAGGAAALLAGLLALLLWPRAMPRPVPPEPGPARLAIVMSQGDEAITGFLPSVALAPDGGTVVYAARRNGVSQLYRRPMNALDAQPLPGTIDARAPFFSPDGRSLGFVANGTLQVLDLATGDIREIARSVGDATATWTPAGEIVFAPSPGGGLQRVSSAGGAPVRVTDLDRTRGELAHLLPQALPGARVLFTIVTSAGHDLAIVELHSGERTLVTRGSHGRLLPGNVLVFWHEGSLQAATLDLGLGTITGSPVRLLEDIEHAGERVAHFDVADGGTMVYLPAGFGESAEGRLAWIDRNGDERAAALEPRHYLSVDALPDSARLALAIREENDSDLWIANPGENTMTQLTSDPATDTAPVWSRGGDFVIFQSNRGQGGLFRRDASASEGVEPVASPAGSLRGPHSWTPDGRSLVFATRRDDGSALVSLRLSDARENLLLESEHAMLAPRVSPDGRWLAYQSDQSGRFEVYVRPFLGGNSLRVSSGGGRSPRWHPDGTELFYLDDRSLLSAPFDGADASPAGTPRRLFDVTTPRDEESPSYVVGGNGSEFLFILPTAEVRPTPHLIVVQGWAREILETLAAR